MSMTMRRYLAGAPLFSLACLYLFYALFAAAPGPGFPNWLVDLMQLEFFAIHAGVMLGMIVFWRSITSSYRLLQWSLFLLLLSAYLYAAFIEAGPGGLIEFIAMTGLTYAGMLLRGIRGSRMAELGARWGISLAGFLLTAAVTGAPQGVDQWENHREVLVFGALYFAWLGGFEISGLYQRWFPRAASSINEQQGRADS
jgi:hypothetical protein